MNPAEKKPISVKALELNHELMGCETMQTKKFTFKGEMDDIDYTKQSTSASTKQEQDDYEECKLPEGFKKPKRSEASTNLSNLLSG